MVMAPMRVCSLLVHEMVAMPLPEPLMKATADGPYCSWSSFHFEVISWMALSHDTFSHSPAPRSPARFMGYFTRVSEYMRSMLA